MIKIILRIKISFYACIGFLILIFMLSNSSKYALKAVLYLTLHTDESRRLQVREISEKIDVPKAYTAKLLQTLSKRGIISSARGPKGGFYVDSENRKQSVMSIIDVIDGRKKMDTCLLGFSDCDEHQPCPLHFYISQSRTELIHILESKSIDELSTDLKERKSFLPL